MTMCKCGCGQNTRSGNVWINGHNSKIENPFSGKRHSVSSKMKNSMAHVARRRSAESRLKQSVSVSGNRNHMYGSHINANEHNGRWKGDDVGYDALHEWIRKNKIMPYDSKCESCGVVRPLQATNISGNYLRDIKDYMYICSKCHYKMDNKTLPSRDTSNGRFIRH